MDTPRDRQVLVRPAVVTGSVAASTGGQPPRPNRQFDETDWTDPDGDDVGPYPASKMLAARTAWAVTGEIGVPIATINPSLPIGRLQ